MKIAVFVAKIQKIEAKNLILGREKSKNGKYFGNRKINTNKL